MSLRPWLSGFRARLNNSRTRRVPTNRGSSSQQLEQRTMLTASALVIGTELTILTDADEAITVQANATSGNAEVQIDGVVLGSGSTIPAGSLTGLTIFAGAGNNQIDLSGINAGVFTSLTSISVDAGDGDDTVIGAADVANALAGGDGNDSITGGSAADTLNGDDGQDTIDAGDGSDEINAGDGDDSVTAGAGNDTIIGDDGDDTVFGGDGDDSIIANNGADSLFGEAGNDTLNGDGGFDSISGGDGDDVVFAGADEDTVSGGIGNDTINGQGGDDSLDGDEGNDRINGQTGKDTIGGGDGNDIVNGNGGDDSLLGNDGNDTIYGGSGDDDANGGLGDDRMRGNSGNDTLCGGLGTDNINGDTGDDLIFSACEIATPTGLAVGDLNIAEGGSADVVLVVDVSGSTSIGFGGTPVGDVNSDGLADSILDAELASLLIFQQDLITRGVTANLSVIAFGSSSTILDMDPSVPGLQTTTTPTADTNNNGTSDFEEVVRSLQITGATNFEAPLQDAITVFTGLGTGGGTLVFLSDGNPNVGGIYTDEVAVLQTAGVNRFAFGVGLGASLPALDLIDSTGMATQVLTSQALATALTGIGVTAQVSLVDIVLSQPAPVAFDVDFFTSPGTATAGVDYASTTGTISFSVGQTTATIPVNVINDTIVEGQETFFVTLANARTTGTMPTPLELSDPVALVTIYDLGSVVPPATPAVPPTTVPMMVSDIDPDGDILVGDEGDDTIFGDLGNDSINGNAGDDVINGGNGNDSALGGAGRDTINGQGGDDTLDGQGGADSIDGGDGDDEVIFEGDEDGNDTIFGGAGGDTVTVNTGITDDTVIIASDALARITVREGMSTLVVDPSIRTVNISGQAGTDLFTIGDLSLVPLSALTVDAGLGDDTIDATGLVSGSVRVRLRGGDGNDTITGGVSGDSLFGDAGDDSIDGGAGNDSIQGGDGDDAINTQDGDDSADGGAGDDSITGGLGNDNLMGGLDGDTLVGNEGDDTLGGGFGDDNLNGNSGNDSLDGSFGRDSISGGSGDDVADGGRDDDLINGQGGNDTILGNHGDDTLNGQNGDDEIVGGDGNDNIMGGSGRDGLAGNDGDDLIQGQGGADTLRGNDGNDTLRGGGSADTLIGDQGDDTLDGDSGIDLGVTGEGADTTLDLETIDESFVLTPFQLLNIDGI